MSSLTKRKSSYSRRVKRTKKSNDWYLRNPRAEIKFLNTTINGALADTFVELTRIDTGGEYDKRIGNNIHIRNVHVQLSTRFTTTTLGSFRVMLVQSKQGVLAGTAGATNAPSFNGDANHNCYKVFHDMIYSWQYGSDDQAQTVQFNAKINQNLKYKNEVGTNYECDKPMYLWIISQTPFGPSTSIHYGRAQLYFSDV